MEQSTQSFYKTVCYREQGLRHIKSGKGCEDCYSVCTDPVSQVTAAALSDGAGSCAHAAEGAEITSRAAAEFMSRKFDRLYDLDDETMADFILQSVRAALSKTAKEQGWTMESLSATLLVAALHPDGRHLFFHVGDGVILGCHKMGTIEVVSQYEHEDEANLTTFVTIQNTEYHIGRGSDTFYGFFLMSDGPESWLVVNGAADARVRVIMQMSFFFPRERVEDELVGIAELLKSRQEQDDLSFVLLADKRKAGAVFRQMEASLREILFGTPLKMKREVERQYETIFQTLAAYPQGLQTKRLCKLLHIRKPAILDRKLEGCLYTNVIVKKNGMYVF